jgi:probable HAF family extracellular repeat protein
MTKALTRLACKFFATLQRWITRSCITEVSFGALVKFQLVLCLSVSGALAQTKYKIIHIPTAKGSTSSALGLNENGQVVGYSFQGEDYQTFLYVYPSGKIGDIGSLGGKLKAACAINDSGAIAGYSQDSNGNLQAFSYTEKSGIISLGTFDGGSTSEAFGINDNNQIVGDSATANVAHRPFLYSGKLQDLGIGTSEAADAFETAYGISESGIAVGRYDSGNGIFHGFQWSNGQVKDLGTLGGSNSEALAISKRTSSLIAGDSDTGNGPTHACAWSNGNPTDLGVLSGFDKASFARAVNRANHVVGDSDSDDQKRAFLYFNNHLYELDQLVVNLDEAGFASLDIAYGINDKEWICGCGTTKDGETHAFLAIPVEGVASHETAQPPVQTAESSDSLNVFYDQLTPMGEWCDCGDYGHVFRPRVPHGWRPYCNGHWVWTDAGWYWDSDEAFGWACFHYGRWIHEADCWCWVPGAEWAPAWVSWRTGPEHCGWAPLPPDAGFGPGIGIGSWCDNAYGLGPGAYFFIAFSHFTARNYDPYILPPEQNVTIIKNTVNVTNITYNKSIVNNYGPSVATIQQKTGAVIKPVALAYQPGKTPGSSISNGVLKVTGPGTKLNPVATKLPPATIKNPHPVVDKGWKGVDPKTATELKTKIAKENPTPPNLPKPTVTPIKVVSGGPSPTASAKPGATVFGASTPPGGVKPLPTGGPKGSATPLKGNIKGGFNPANPGAAGITKSPSGTPKPTGTPLRPGGAVTPGLPSGSPKPTGTPGRPGGVVTPGTQLQGSPTPKPTVGGGGATPTPHIPTPTPKPVEHVATPTPHHSATPPPTPHPTVHLATPPPHHATPAVHRATPTPHPHTVSTPKVIHKPEGGGGGGNKGGGTTQHNQPVYHPSGGGGGNKPSGGGGKPAGGGGGKPKPTPTPKK